MAEGAARKSELPMGCFSGCFSEPQEVGIELTSAVLWERKLDSRSAVHVVNTQQCPALMKEQIKERLKPQL